MLHLLGQVPVSNFFKTGAEARPPPPSATSIGPLRRPRWQMTAFAFARRGQLTPRGQVSLLASSTLTAFFKITRLQYSSQKRRGFPGICEAHAGRRSSKTTGGDIPVDVCSDWGALSLQLCFDQYRFDTAANDSVLGALSPAAVLRSI